MTKQEAIKVLENHQRWRKGDDEVEATNPKELTKAIEVAIISLGDSLEDKYRWRKASEELPSNEYKNEVMPQTLCLTKSKRYGIKLLAYNHSYDVWDDEYLDDYVCDRDDIEEWKPID